MRGKWGAIELFVNSLIYSAEESISDVEGDVVCQDSSNEDIIFSPRL